MREKVHLSSRDFQKELNNVTERGKYIVVEGQDGTGKTTQANLLQERLELEGKKVIHIKEPGGSPIAEEIRGVILNGNLERTPMTNILLFTAIRHELWKSVIQPALDEGMWVICTRSYWSTLAYQGYGQGMDLGVISAITNTFTDKNYMNPDLGVMLTLDDNTRLQRIAQRGALQNPDPFEAQNSTFQAKVNDGYIQIAKEHNIPILDASKSIDEISKEIWNETLRLLDNPRRSLTNL